MLNLNRFGYAPNPLTMFIYDMERWDISYAMVLCVRTFIQPVNYGGYDLKLAVKAHSQVH